MILTMDGVRNLILKGAGLDTDTPIGTVNASGTATADMSKRLVWVTANTTDIDSDREVVVPGGAVPDSRFFSLGNVFIDHKYTGDFIIGRKRKALPRFNTRGEQDAWTVQFHVYPLTKSRYADDILTIAEAGGLTVSVGIQGLDFGKTTNVEKLKYKQADAVPLTIVRTWNWLELSVTFMPANLRCRQMGYGENFGEWSPEVAKCMAITDRLICKGKIQKETADALGFSRLLPKPKYRGILITSTEG
jgi:hypothetical protein